jgi:hypothetical protein
MSDAVRARLKDGRETNLSPFFARRLEAEVLDEPTTRPDGSARPDTRASGRKVKPKTSVDEASTAKKAANASDKKEN